MTFERRHFRVDTCAQNKFFEIESKHKSTHRACHLSERESEGTP
jgi:hypothetical protein